MTRNRNDDKARRVDVFGRVQLLALPLDDLARREITTRKDAGRVIMRAAKELYYLGLSLAEEENAKDNRNAATAKPKQKRGRNND